MRGKNRKSGLVYSTDHGRMCPGCNNSVASCICSQEKRPAQTDGIVRLRRETKGRKGKGVTLVTGLALGDRELKKLAKSFKQKCGCGGSLKNGVIEIQGDQRDILERELVGRGYKVKQAGG